MDAYAEIQFPDERKSVSTSDLAPCVSPENLVDHPFISSPSQQAVHTLFSSDDHSFLSEHSELSPQLVAHDRSLGSEAVK